MTQSNVINFPRQKISDHANLALIHELEEHIRNIAADVQPTAKSLMVENNYNITVNYFIAEESYKTNYMPISFAKKQPEPEIDDSDLVEAALIQLRTIDSQVKQLSKHVRDALTRMDQLEANRG